MAVTVTVPVALLDEKQLYAIPGLVPFRLQGTATGDAGGGRVTFTFNFNPSSGSLQRYWAFTEVMVGALGIFTYDVGVVTVPADWLRGLRQGSAGALASSALYSGKRLVTPDRPIILGQVQPDTDGSITVTFETNNNTLVYDVYIAGVYSPRPFVLPTVVAV